MPLNGLIVTQTAAPGSEKACDWLSVNASNVLISLVIWVLIPWLAAMKCKIIKMELRVGAPFTDRAYSCSHMSAYPDISVGQSFTSFGTLFDILTLCVHHLFTLRCVTLRQRLGGMQLVWLWWTHSWTSCRVAASTLSSSLRVCSRRPQTVLWVQASASTQYCTFSQGRRRVLSLNMNVYLHCCLCKGLHRRCMWFKHQYRNLQFAAPLLHWKDHAGVPGKT